MQEEQRAAQTALREAEAVQEEVEGSLTNNLKKRQEELEALLADSEVAVDKCFPYLAPFPAPLACLADLFTHLRYRQIFYRPLPSIFDA